MAQTFFECTRTDKTPAAGSWQDIDCSAQVPEGATGAIFEVHNSSTNTSYSYGYTKPGATGVPNYTVEMPYKAHAYVVCGLNGSRICRFYTTNAAIKVYLVGYTKAGVVFLDTIIDKTPEGTDWATIDVSEECPQATGVILYESIPSATAGGYGARKNGSTDNRKYQGSFGQNLCFIIGCDSQQRFQFSKYYTNYSKCYVCGYITDGVTFNVNAVDITPAAVGSEENKFVASGAVYAFIEMVNDEDAFSRYAYTVKKRYGDNDTYGSVAAASTDAGGGHAYAMCACDGEGYITLKRENSHVKFYLIGYGMAITPVVADFEADVIEGVAPLEVQFSDLTIGGEKPYTYDWDFGDNTQHDTQSDPKHVYYEPGYYTVKLTVTDDESQADYEEKVNYIFVKPPEVLVELAQEVDYTPAQTEAWVERNVSGDVDEDATGVLLRLENTGAAEGSWGIRKNGSTDTVTGTIQAGAQVWAFIGTGAGQIFELYISSTNIKCYLYGYSLYGVAFLTNGVDKTPGSTGWVDTDCSAQTEHEPVGLIFRIKNKSADTIRAYGLRKNGSTDAFTQGQAGYLNIAPGAVHYAMIGCDASVICEVQVSSISDVEVFLVGYIFGGMAFFTNAHDKSLSNFGSYVDVDLSGEAPTSAWGIIQVNCQDAAGRYAALRYPGKSADDYNKVTYGAWKPQHVSSEHVFEAKVQDTTVDFWLVGYVEQTALVFMTIDGIVRLGTTPVSGAEVICYNLTKRVFVGRQVTDQDGEYTFVDAGYEFEEFLVAAHYVSGDNRYGMCKRLMLEEES